MKMYFNKKLEQRIYFRTPTACCTRICTLVGVRAGRTSFFCGAAGAREDMKMPLFVEVILALFTFLMGACAIWPCTSWAEDAKKL